ncbi:MAG TPA: tRNA pseudouridine(55) synthase TruB [bacterium]|nr:tRNA pseudouridine(55) synthase TruB [bacterium]
MNEQPVEGILLVDKPTAWTSHDVCAFVRKQFKIKKVGHAGTLDPLATGLLVVLLGRATKKSILFSSCDKEYSGVMELGVKTDSHDRQGKVLDTRPWEGITFEDIRQKALQFTGEIIQVPPMVSALKHHGVRLYQLARRGVEVAREGRKVVVHELNIQKKDGPFVRFSARVSKGTYLRTLVHDLGEVLGCFATLAELRRRQSGNFRYEDSVTIETLRQWTVKELRLKVLPVDSISYANLHKA